METPEPRWTSLSHSHTGLSSAVMKVKTGHGNPVFRPENHPCHWLKRKVTSVSNLRYMHAKQHRSAGWLPFMFELMFN